MPRWEGSAKGRESLNLHLVQRNLRYAQALVTDLGTAELARSGGREALLFRENTLATKAIDEYMKLVAQDYLQETLGEARVVKRLLGGLGDCRGDLGVPG